MIIHASASAADHHARFRRRRQQARRDQVNETQLDVRDLTRGSTDQSLIVVPASRSLRASGREGRYWPTLDHAARPDPAGFRLADDPQPGVFRRAAEVTCDAGNDLTRIGSHDIFASALATDSTPSDMVVPGAAGIRAGGALQLNRNRRDGYLGEPAGRLNGEMLVSRPSIAAIRCSSQRSMAARLSGS